MITVFWNTGRLVDSYLRLRGMYTLQGGEHRVARMAALVQLQTTGLMARVQILAGKTDFSVLLNIQTYSGTNPPPIQWVPRILPPGDKGERHEADHLLQPSAEVKNG
jgi:hypothetical protein